MSRLAPVNVAASIRQRLLNGARARRDEFQRVLVRYGIERLLYRLATSDYRHQFVLKGAMLFEVWGAPRARLTRDVDLLGFGDPTPHALEEAFRAILTTPPTPDDGLIFDPRSVRARLIREDVEYGGVRITFVARLDGARVPLQVDVGFGDAVVPAPDVITFPTILDLPAPVLRSYPREVVVAEKFEAMIDLGLANTRFKDFYDIWYLAAHFAFDGTRLNAALHTTLGQRGTAIPTDRPSALRADFSDDPVKQRQWAAFLRRAEVRDHGAAKLPAVMTAVGDFILPAVASGFAAIWPAGGPWREATG